MNQPTLPETPCSFDECPNLSRRTGLCWGHVKQQQRGQPLTPLRTGRIASNWNRLAEAALAYGEVDSTDDLNWNRGRDNLRKAALAYASGLEQSHH